jgi:8-oxo-dGTP pyrophosphatase MutT (NUDIX family)
MTEPGSAATVLLRRPDGKILMQLRDDGGGRSIPFPNMWNFPGGLVEQSETPLEAAVREIREEFELEIEPAACQEIWRYTHDHARDDHVFLCEVPQDAAPVLNEGAALAWMSTREIADLRLGFDHAKILPHIPADR